ncbi:MAG TPA: hypothetical protein VGE57_13710 [Solimonas sp.]
MSTPAPDKETATILNGRVAFVEALGVVAGDATLELALLSYDLDARVFGDESFVEKVQALALRHHRARIRVLVNATERTMHRAHRLVELGRRLTSRIEFRQLPDDEKAVIEEYLVADEKGVLQRDANDRLEARHYAYAPLEARRRLKAFNALWDVSVPARELGELRL